MQQHQATDPSPRARRPRTAAAALGGFAVSMAVLLTHPAGAVAGPALAERWAAGATAVVLFDGDSITAGMNLDDPEHDGFPALFARMLHERFPQTTFRFLVAGVPGAPTQHALDVFESQRKVRPDLVILQYGGNDKGTGDGLAGLTLYEQNLRQLITIWREAGAACLLITPPMHEPVPNMPYPTTARNVGRSLSVPVADIDTVLKARDHDYRGFFPYFVHPREYEHAAMARELYRAFEELIEQPAKLRLASPELTVAPAVAGGVVPLPLAVANLDTVPRTITLASDGMFGTIPPLTVEPGATATATGSLLLPHTLSGGRSLEWPLWLSAASDGQREMAPVRVTVVPELNCPLAGTAGAEAPVATLSAPHLMFGRGNWYGPADLSANVYLNVDAEHLRLRVDVTDNQVGTGGAPQDDGLELYLDLRADGQRGKPFFSPQCALLFLAPPAKGRPAVVTTATQDKPDPALLSFKPVYTVLPGGYRFELNLPRATLDQVAGHRVVGLGFDLAVDDADNGERKTQMMWVGRPDNYVNPRRWAELRLDGTAGPGAVRVTVF